MCHPSSLALSPRAISLVELLAVVAIAVVLAALLYPALRGAADRANESKCVSNLKQISIASASYSSDHNGDWPPSKTQGPIFANGIMPYLKSVPARGAANFMNSPLICPGSKTDLPDGSYRFRGIYTPTSYTDPQTGQVIAKYGLSYAQNTYAPGTGNSSSVPNRLSVNIPSQMMLYMDFEGHYVATIGSINDPEKKRLLESRHNQRINIAFADGSVRPIHYDEIPKATGEMPNPFWQGRTRNQ